MSFPDFPQRAAWLHGSTRTAFESATFERHGYSWQVAGCTTAIEAGASWWMAYDITLDDQSVTRRAEIITRVGAASERRLVLEADGKGTWFLDGRPASHLDGCLDVDLESSAMTNALPIRRSIPAVGRILEAPAVYVRVHDAAVQRLEQRYERVDDQDHQLRFEYSAPAFDFGCQIRYDRFGLVVEYPGIARRVE